jgi:hypothetical protein
MHATIFGNVASIVARIYRRRQEYDMKVLTVTYIGAKSTTWNNY